MDTTTNVIDAASVFVNKDLLTLLSSHVDWICFMLVIFGGLFAKYYLKELTAITLFGKNITFSTTTKTLVSATVFISAYIFIMYIAGQLHKEDYTKYFMSYCFATSTYEIVIKRMLKVLKIDKEDK